MASNFDFLKNNWFKIAHDAAEAEKYAFTAPKYGAILCRSVLEQAVYWLYENEHSLELPYKPNLVGLIKDFHFTTLLGTGLSKEIDLIRLTGNNAAHGKTVSRNESLIALKALFHFLGFLSRYYSEDNPVIPPFDETLIPDDKAQEKQKAERDHLLLKLEEQQKQLVEQQKRARELARANDLLKLQQERQLELIAERKAEREKLPVAEQAIPGGPSEAETRRAFIDILLKDSGWEKLRNGRELEFEVTGMPLSTNPSGIGYADYVLWGDDGLPLAVIEAKKTMVDPRKGKHQAELYANCLEQMTGQRPVIFYTNGFETYLWDDTFYPERQVSGFYTKEELQLAVDRRKSRTDLRTFKVNTSIVGRPYQLEAIKRVSEAFAYKYHSKLKGRSRKALLVMATGSGKTRTAAAMVDLFTKCNWVKRVLFLADRNALVTQAKNAFKEHVPNLSAIDLTQEKEDVGTRVVFSTYPTIMNKIDSLKVENGRFYSPGHFDLIIIDEAHRSVYQKYKAIFDYFDSLLIGLTATPKTDVDRNTYSLFDIEDNNPTFAYELNQAVRDKYLVPPKALSVPVKFPREGIRYKDLSEVEKEEYEEKFGDPTEGESPDEIEGSALNSWLFNNDTVDKVLEFLMTNGVKTHGGDRLGKTIIFAKSHKHALFIEDRFNKNYPEYSGKFLRVIDNYETKAQDLLESFCLPKEEIDPQIAVSVDMMDTGVDAPRVVNLVFFKPVKSAAKYWQMIGRGTRLCPGLFAPGEDKTHFLIFDFCENFEFFDQFPEGVLQTVGKSLSQRIFEAKLELALALVAADQSTDDDLKHARVLLDELHQQIANLDRKRFIVRKEIRYVEEFKNRARWELINQTDFAEICEHLSNLPALNEDSDELAKRFDMIILDLQLAIVNTSPRQQNLITRIAGVARKLVKKKNIPAIADKMVTLNAVQTDEFWSEVNMRRLEQVRMDMRELIKFLDRDKTKDVYTNFQDEIHDADVQEFELIPRVSTMPGYRERVESFVRNNASFLVIQKIKKNEVITKDELKLLENLLFADGLGTKDDFKKEYGDLPLVKFIRSILGLDINTANELFADFIQSGTLSADQVTFINSIISYLTKNGTIDKAMLFEPPFTDINDQGIVGVFDDGQVVKIVSIIDRINGAGDAGVG
ncbi:DEAD/DEAH box helicase family protein [Mangrovibacterium marinum]|uniref:DEAD/DEAH box helicase family protein n=1 Tax=Mangrovibacterium marinum TaxID=1639118 RepID=UPI002A187021|nr:DEAD/DEAH box helicase family protein [Mangrovibacterium marinum]